MTPTESHPLNLGRRPDFGGRRPRLLFLARGFPPARASACNRTWNVAKYLTRMGWEVTVVTLHPSVWRRIDNPEEVERKIKEAGIKRILTDHQWRCLDYNHLDTWNGRLGWFWGRLSRGIARRLGFDDGIGWIGPAERACSVLSKGDIDLILATAHPVSAFRLAYRLSKRLGCPYVMDYRDPWTENPHNKLKIPSRRIQEEAHLLAESAAVTIVSRSWADALERQHSLNGKLHVITNGYDAENLAHVEAVKFGHFAIVYTGVFYLPKRVITPIFQALELLKHSYPAARDWFFHYYGPHQSHVRDEAARHSISDRVLLHGEVSWADAVSAVRGAGVAVVITSVSKQASLDEQGIITGKIFEPLGLNVPVLLVAPSGSDAEAVVRTTGVGEVFEATDVAGITRFLYKLVSGHEPQRRDGDQYSWVVIAKRLDLILRRVLEENSAQQIPELSYGSEQLSVRRDRVCHERTKCA